ncbi:hypothetical protein BDU57DRAFT_522484 [Ampelomyces quisqualis]|uniref:Uncharacterized protein n=1 Tax=Ampelomyces quisqualis TaxID=50730 RepID=A0A6A5QA89_AMPQU|nr:hypothetical protein BDU57DRAFT_522484 [Ampelomyces quisqualis]
MASWEERLEKTRESWNRGSKRRGGPLSGDGKRRKEDTDINNQPFKSRPSNLRYVQCAEDCEKNDMPTGAEDSEATFGQKPVADVAVQGAATDTQQMDWLPSPFLRLSSSLRANFYGDVANQTTFHCGTLLEYMPKHLISTDRFCQDICPNVPTMVASYGGSIHTGMGSEVTVMCGPLRCFFADIWPIHEEARCLHAFENFYLSIRTADVRADGLMPISPYDEKLSAMFASLPHLKRFVVEWVVERGEREPVTTRLEEGLRLLLQIGYKEDVDPEIFIVTEGESMQCLFEEADRQAGPEARNLVKYPPCC